MYGPYPVRVWLTGLLLQEMGRGDLSITLLGLLCFLEMSSWRMLV